MWQGKLSLIVLAAGALVPVVAGAAETEADTRPATDASFVVVVCLVEGPVELQPASGAVRSLKLLDRLGAGDLVRPSTGGRAVLTAHDGRRFELLGPQQASRVDEMREEPPVWGLAPACAEAEVSKDGVVCRDGKLQELARVPVIPKLEPILTSESLGLDTAVSRVRGAEGEAWDCVSYWPPTGALVLADKVTLGIMPHEAATGYRLQIKNHDHETVYEHLGDSPELTVPPETLEPGQSYRWLLVPAGSETEQRLPWQVFETLSKDGQEARAQLAATAAHVGSPDLFILLAALDSRLWLWNEPCEDLRTAIHRGGPEQAIQETMAALGCASDTHEAVMPTPATAVE